METIKKICEVNKSIQDDTIEGYEIHTDKNVYGFYISNQRSCCESWGHICSNDGFDFFIEKKILEINYMKTTGEMIEVDIDVDEDEFEFISTMFVNIKTTDGYVLEFAVYNSHNGYYGHNVYFVKNEKILQKEII